MDSFCYGETFYGSDMVIAEIVKTRAASVAAGRPSVNRDINACDRLEVCARRIVCAAVQGKPVPKWVDAMRLEVCDSWARGNERRTPHAVRARLAQCVETLYNECARLYGTTDAE